MSDVPTATGVLDALHALGIGLAIDDFGTGYSSLSYLTRFPVDSLKVDGSFVAALGRSGNDLAVVTAITNMAHALGLCVVAEGVETEAQLATLRELGCDLAQGYHLGRPSAPEAVEKLATAANAAGRGGSGQELAA